MDCGTHGFRKSNRYVTEVEVALAVNASRKKKKNIPIA
jgi:hypothetical protein